MDNIKFPGLSTDNSAMNSIEKEGPSPYMTLTEAAAYLRCNPKVLSRWVQANRLRHGRAGRDLRFKSEWLDQFVEAGSG